MSFCDGDLAASLMMMGSILYLFCNSSDFDLDMVKKFQTLVGLN